MRQKDPLCESSLFVVVHERTEDPRLPHRELTRRQRVAGEAQALSIWFDPETQWLWCRLANVGVSPSSSRLRFRRV